MSELEILKKEIELDMIESISLNEKAEKFNDEVGEKIERYTTLWLKDNKKLFPFKIGDFIKEANSDTIHKITKINFRPDRVIIDTLMIISDSINDIEVRKSYQVIYLQGLNLEWDYLIKEDGIMLYETRDYETKLLDFIFDLSKEGI